jgi:two-component system, OmpR family, sensor histidine kinase VicK
MIWRSGADGKCDYVNQTWRAFTGRTLEQELGDGWTEGVHPEDRDRCLGMSLDHFLQRAPFEMEYRLRRHDGLYRFIADRRVPCVESGEFRGFIGSGIDVDERQQIESARGTFLRMMAHELRTPLQAVKVFAELMRRNAAAGRPNSPETFEKLSVQFDRFGRHIEDLAEAGRMKELRISFEPLDLEEVLRELVEFRSESLRTISDGRRHMIVLRSAGEPVPVRGDRQRLEQVFNNLLDNAVKYSPRGGRIQISLDSGDGRHRVWVQDDGIGIPDGEILLVGRRFFRASNVSTGYPGVGLGLSLAREILERHAGDLRIESELGKGTRVTVSLPSSRGGAP